MRVYATELICSTGVLGFHTIKLALCINNKLRSHAEILSWWAFEVTFPGSNPLSSNRSGLNVSNGGSWNPKFTLKVNSFWIKIKGQNYASQMLSRHTFKISRKKGSDFFDHRGTLSLRRNPPLVRVTRAQNVCTEIIYIVLQTSVPSSQKQSFPLNKQHQMAKIKFQVHMNVKSKLLSKWNWWWNFTCVSKISLNSLNLTFSLQDNNHMVKDVY